MTQSTTKSTGEPRQRMKRCPKCKGSGYVMQSLPSVYRFGPNVDAFRRGCFHCWETGKVEMEPSEAIIDTTADGVLLLGLAIGAFIALVFWLNHATFI